MRRLQWGKAAHQLRLWNTELRLQRRDKLDIYLFEGRHGRVNRRNRSLHTRNEQVMR